MRKNHHHKKSVDRELNPKAAERETDGRMIPEETPVSGEAGGREDSDAKAPAAEAEKPVQASLDPHGISEKGTPQASLDPQDSYGNRDRQASLDPQDPSGREIPQGSLDPHISTERDHGQGSLVPEAASETASDPAPAKDRTGTAADKEPAGEGKESASDTAPAKDGTESASDTAPAKDETGSAADKDAAISTDRTDAGTGTEEAEPPAASGAAEPPAASEEAASPAGPLEADSAEAPAGEGTGEASATAEFPAVSGAAELPAVLGAAEPPAVSEEAASPAASQKSDSAAPPARVESGEEKPEKSEKPEKKKKKKRLRRGARAFFITFFILAAILGGIYYAGYKYCETHFMPGSSINGFDCSTLTEEETEKRFADAANKYTLNIHFRGGTTEVLTARDIGFAYKPDGSISAMLTGQDRMLWPRYFFEETPYTMELGGTCDPDKLNEALAALPELQEETMRAPENAYIRFRDGSETEDGVFEIVPEDPGTTIDLVQLAAGAADAAARYEPEIDAEAIANAYREASLKADNAELVTRCRDLNDLVSASITYVLPDKEELKLNSDVMKDWLVRDKKGRLVKDEEVWDEEIWKFMELLAYNSNTIGTDREFETTERGKITVTGGDYGYMVNQIAEHDLLVKDLAEGKKETRKPSYYISPYNEELENDGIGKTYLEVDLTAQHMWCYIDGEMVMQSDCVTGDPTTDHETPTGVFGIMFMKKDATLRGIQQKNGKYEYETKVSYWMPFYSDCGFHDAWWRTAFGGEIYRGDGSHGCVNLPSEAAEELFSYCDTKMPVVVYK